MITVQDSLAEFPPSVSLAELIHHEWVRLLGNLVLALLL